MAHDLEAAKLNSVGIFAQPSHGNGL
jgi:hypothetical protein